MKKSYDHILPFSKEFLLDQYASKEFYEARIKMDGIEGSKIIDFKQAGSETSFRIDREVEIRTHSAPRFIQKFADKFVGESAIISTVVSWNKEKAIGVNSIQAKGVPVSVAIKFRLSDISENETLFKTDLDISAKIPIVGKQLEKFIMPKAAKVLDKDFERAIEYFKILNIK